MPRHRTTARGVLFLLFASLALAAGVTGATAKVPRLIFPIVGPATYIDDFGDARGQGSHQANDIMSIRKAPAVAVEAGKVSFWTTSSLAGCMLYLYGASGTTYLYIHLNNDLTAKNDNRGACKAGVSYAPGLKDGAKVKAGQLIGYVGDSGDADGGQPHLHFELHPNGGAAVSPYTYLQKATRLLFYAKPGTRVWLTLQGSVAATPTGTLSLKLSKLQVWPSKQVITLSRRLVLSLATDLKVELPREVPSLQLQTGLGALRAGMPVTVHTVPRSATLAAQRGDASAITAARIVLGGEVP
jgi:Peptidase family M23